MIYYIRDEEGSLIGLKYNNKIYYYIKNLQEDIIGITDSNYNEVCRYEYDSFGKVITIKDNNGNIIEDESHIGIINPYRYRSYYYDKETKLYYLNSRYYNPEWGRFINVDEGIVTDSVEGLNMYLYANNNFINFGDENGDLPKWLKKAAKKVLVGAAVIGACAIAVAVTGGAASGFASGTVVGAATGFASSVAKAKNAVGHWDKGTFNTPYDSMSHHYNKHGGEIPRNNIVNYTNDALDFANRNSDVLQYTNPSWSNTMHPGFTAPYSQGHPNGWFTSDGNIFTFWYTKIK